MNFAIHTWVTRSIVGTAIITALWLSHTAHDGAGPGSRGVRQFSAVPPTAGQLTAVAARPTVNAQR